MPFSLAYLYAVLWVQFWIYWEETLHCNAFKCRQRLSFCIQCSILESGSCAKDHTIININFVLGFIEIRGLWTVQCSGEYFLRIVSIFFLIYNAAHLQIIHIWRLGMKFMEIPIKSELLHDPKERGKKTTLFWGDY